MAVEIGKKAPTFTAKTDTGEKFSLSSFKGKSNVLLYFYPKDDTPGCTKEACAFRDDYKRFAKLNTEIVGVSPDSEKSHQKFRNKYDLNFTLISDEDRRICEKYGVWVEKSMYGRKYMGVQRATFLIDKAGKIAAIWPKVSVTGHSEEVLEKLKEIEK